MPSQLRRLASLGDALALLLGVLAIDAPSFGRLVAWSAVGVACGALRQGLQAVIQAEGGSSNRGTLQGMLELRGLRVGGWMMDGRNLVCHSRSF